MKGTKTMKFGVADFGMSVWDGGLYDLQSRLEGLKAIGYDGRLNRALYKALQASGMQLQNYGTVCSFRIMVRYL